jgi:hypothetical protein
MPPGSALVPRAVAALLATTLVVASLLPCPSPRGDAPRPTAAHGHASHAAHGAEAERAARHADCAPVFSLRAPCSCGCADTPGSDANPARLPVALLAASDALSTASTSLVVEADSGALPDSPRHAIEHVPLHRLA